MAVSLHGADGIATVIQWSYSCGKEAANWVSLDYHPGQPVKQYRPDNGMALSPGLAFHASVDPGKLILVDALKSGALQCGHDASLFRSNTKC